MGASRARALDVRRGGREIRRASPAALVYLRGRDADGRLRGLLGRRAALRPRLAALSVAFLEGRAHETLGFAALGDWSRERIGMGARVVREWARVWRLLCELPVLRQAVLAGDVSWTVARKVVGEATPQTDRAVTECVRGRTVRAVEAMLAAFRVVEGKEGAPPATRRVRVNVEASGDTALKWVAACEIARRASGEALPTWECAEAIVAEALAAFGGGVGATAPAACERRVRRPVRSAAETEAFRTRSCPAADEPPDFRGRKARELDGRMRAAVGELQALDFEVGRILRQVVERKLWRELGFGSFDDYVREGLDLAPRTARRLVRLARAPQGVASAFREGRITMLQAEVLMRGGDVDFAEKVTLRRLEEEVPEFSFWAPADVAAMFEEMRRRVGLEAMLDAALATWLSQPDPVHRVVKRDGYRCVVPGCSARRNLQVHHVVFRSRGGGDEEGNLVTLCAWHHLRGVHEGRVRITGRAPGGLTFRLGVGRLRSGDVWLPG